MGGATSCASRNLQPLGLENKCTNDPAYASFPTLIGYDNNFVQVPASCTPWGVAGVDLRKNVCDQLGNYSGEWEPYLDNGTTIPLPSPNSQDYTTTGPYGCTYNTCNGVQDFNGLGCCEGCCGISGVRVFCRRKAYRANPVNCCFLDKNFTGDPTSCFTSAQIQSGGFSPDLTQNATCDPTYRDINNTSCMPKVEEYCSGSDLVDPNDTRWMDRWLTGDKACIYALNRRLYNLPYGSPAPLFVSKGMDFIDPSTVISSNIKPDGNIFARRIIASAMQKYTDQGFQIGAKPGASGYHPFQDLLDDICTKSPGMCQDGLRNACSSLTAKQLSTRPDLIKWCGCYLPPQEYEKYTNQFQLTVECTPLCSRPEAIKLSAENGLTEKTCQQDACIIDDINIALANTTVQGSIKFNQLCGGCSGNCRCMMSNVTILAANSFIGGNIDLSQQCGGAVQCFTDDPVTGKPTQVPCDSNDAAGMIAQIQAQQKAAAQAARKRTIYIWLGVIAGIAVIGFIIYLLVKNNSKLGTYDGSKLPGSVPPPIKEYPPAVPLSVVPNERVQRPSPLLPENVLSPAPLAATRNVPAPPSSIVRPSLLPPLAANRTYLAPAPPITSLPPPAPALPPLLPPPII